MSKRDTKTKIGQEHSCYICGKKPAYFQKGYMDGKYLCQTHAIHHLKYTRLMMKTLVIIVIAVAIVLCMNSGNDKKQKPEAKNSTYVSCEKAASISIN